MKNILVPTDFSIHASKAFEVAVTMAKQFGYGVTLFTALTPKLRKLFLYAAGVSKVTEAASQENELVSYVNEKLVDLSSDPIFNGVTVDVSVLPYSDDSSHDHIVSFLSPKKFAMVVMGNEGSTGRRESVANLVVRNCNLPVVSVKDVKGDFKVENILMLTDFEDIDPRFVKYVKTLQSKFNATLHIGYINTIANYEESANTDKLYHEFVQKNKLNNTESHVYNAKRIEAGMLGLCARVKPDLIVMPTHGRKGLARLFSGSIAEDFINHVPTPTLVYNEYDFIKESSTSAEASYATHAYTRGFSG